MLLNLLFAVAYALCGPGAIAEAQPATFGSLLLESFFLSVQTLATVGYGHLAPASLTANIIATIEMFFGLLMVAIMTGLVFARFSRPQARIVFSDRAVVAPYHEGASCSASPIRARISPGARGEGAVQSHVNVNEEPGGQRYFTLELERSRVAIIPPDDICTRSRTEAHFDSSKALADSAPSCSWLPR